MTSPDNRARRSAWREPMVWLVAAIPAASVVASIALLVVASRSSGNNDVVADQVQRTAQIQVADLGPDAKARQLRLGAIVRVGRGAIEVLPVDGEFDRNMPLVLTLHHPARAKLDRSFTMAPTRDGWRVVASTDFNHDWNARLAPTDGAWRLQGRWTGGQQAAYLRPALAVD